VVRRYLPCSSTPWNPFDQTKAEPLVGRLRRVICVDENIPIEHLKRRNSFGNKKKKIKSFICWPVVLLEYIF